MVFPKKDLTDMLPKEKSFDAVLGIRPEQSIAMFRGDLTSRFEPADGICQLSGVLFTIDPSSGKCTDATRIYEEITP